MQVTSTALDSIRRTASGGPSVSDALRLPIEPAIQTPELILPHGVRSKH